MANAALSPESCPFPLGKGRVNARSAEGRALGKAGVRSAPWTAEPVPQLAPGRPGKDGLLDIRLTHAPQRSRTVLRALSHRPPLQLGRLLYPDPDLPDMAYCYTAMLAGGLAQGDRLQLRVSLDPGAQAHVTTLAATKVYRAERNGAEQRVTLDVAAGAYLEWWPDPLIPFREARFWQHVDLAIDPEATLLYADLILPGRSVTSIPPNGTHSDGATADTGPSFPSEATGATVPPVPSGVTGERHEYAYYDSRLTARRPDGALLFTDTQALAPPPPGGRPLRETLPDGLHTIGTVYVLAPPSCLGPLLEDLRAWLASVHHHTDGRPRQALSGCSLLPNQCGLVVRFLAADGAVGRRLLAGIAAVARRLLRGAGPPIGRKS